jgi:pimeloyl-ACP methyl ester carboxylesterase
VILSRVRRRLLQVSAVLLFLVLAGATYQGVATALERRQFPHPGQLTDVGGHQLHLYCTGEGSPTVLLEAPAAGMSAAWGWVQPDIAETTRVCSYDRAGLGWSEAGERTFNPDLVPEQLAALLARASEKPPFVVAGQGFGAALARLEARRFGGDAVALVLIDPPAGLTTSADGAVLVRTMRMSPWLARIGLLRATGMLAEHAAGLPAPERGVLTAFLNRPDHLTRASLELARWDDVVSKSAAAALPPALAVTEITVGGQGPVTFLGTRESAGRATAAILAAVHAVRRR